MGALELFDSSMQFQMPPDSDIALLPKEAQERFKAVRAADAKLGKAIAHRESGQARTKQNTADRLATEDELKKLAPRWTATDEARAFIASERAQRVREGY
jgi:hypothetical protein